MGQVTGISPITGNTASHAFLYTGTPGSGGVMHDLGTLGGTKSNGVGVNDAGQVVGSSQITGDTASHAFRYDGTPGSSGLMRDLGALGGTSSSARAINNAGQVAGDSQLTGNQNFHAFRYDGTPGSGGVMHDLGTLGGAYSYGNALNGAGQVAGSSRLAGDTASHAFLYTGTPGAGGQMLDLDAWLDANNAAEGAKWELNEALGISNTGWITGRGAYDPDGPGGIALATRAYLLDASSLLVVPEPSSLTLLTLAALPLLRRRQSCALVRRSDSAPVQASLLSSRSLFRGDELMRSRHRAFAIAMMFMAATSAPELTSAAPPYSGTIFIDPDIITPADPTTYVSATYTGQGKRVMFDRRTNSFNTYNAYLVNVAFSDRPTVEFEVNPEFGSSAAAMALATRFGPTIGRLPTVERRHLKTVWIHDGVQGFGGGNNNLLIHLGQANIYDASGILEETFVHESAHTSLDADHASSAGWLAAQAAGPEFISTYARDNPTREDVAESFLPWLAVRYFPNRISVSDFNLITSAIPNRLAYFDAQHFNRSPLVPESSSLTLLALAAPVLLVRRRRSCAPRCACVWVTN
jgi:probable HAF family extracellular repeat protein